MHEQFLSNTYLVADSEGGGPAFFVDAGGPVEPLIATAERLGLEPTHVLLTHGHFDHVSEAASLCERWPGLEVLIHPAEQEVSGGLADAVTGAGGRLGEMGTAADAGTGAGEPLHFGALEVKPLATPGHTAGMLSLLVSEGDGGVVFTGDTLFKGSVGGVRAPGHTTYADLKQSIMGTLMELPRQTIIYPGHTDATTVAAEWETNPFVRVWRGLDAEGSDACTALGEQATLILLAPDYDGGKKAWVRWPDGSDDIVPGSRVEPA